MARPRSGTSGETARGSDGLAPKRAPRRIYKKRLVLLDAHAILHRAYHALPEFTGPSGEPTGALYGLVSMLLRILADLKPDYLAACYDLPKPTVRHEAYEAYKGTRAKTDDALVAQLAKSRVVFSAFSIPLYEREGFEADDLLGTIARKMKEEKDTEVIIASGDMDTLQLIDDGQVKVYTLKKGLNDTVMYDDEAVKERYGFAPELIPDYKGLRGDPSDNIKGVPGIGEKTATELVAKFGTVEHLYEALKKGGEAAFLAKGVKPRVVKLLSEHEEDARFSKALATIRTDAPIAFALPAKPWKEGVRIEPVLEMFDEFGFRSLRERARRVLADGSGDEEEGGEEDAYEEAAPDATRFAEAQAMLWLLASDFTNPTLEDVLAYAKCRTFDEAYDALHAELGKAGRLLEVYEKIEKPLVPVVRAMTDRGILVDTEVLAKLSKTYTKELADIEARIYEAAGHP
ncbi:MAG: hypothetical protein KGI41_04270, partial [Patescibacteria group bacterium]|nr:hypothetical protein [Patescibacteria group bacterium]